MNETLTALILILTLASLAALLSHTLGMGVILGLLVAGVVAGPHGLGLAADVDTLRHWSEIGVAFLLFAIGLELHPARLWKMRRDVFGLGAAQMILTALLIGGVVWGITHDLLFAMLAGAGLALSSTAMILQTLRERGEFDQPHGQVAFAILLFQDMAIVPLAALTPLLALSMDQLDWAALPSTLLRMAAVVAFILVVGRWGLPQLLRLASRKQSREAFHGLLLATVLGAALLSEYAGLSMALGAFLLGLMLSDGEGCLSIEETVRPLKTLLLGFFFVVVGMSIALPEVPSLWLTLVLGVPGILLIKAVVLFALVRISGRKTETARLNALYLPQCGEFGFVLFAKAAAAGLLDDRQQTVLILLISLTMLATPFLVRFANRRS